MPSIQIQLMTGPGAGRRAVFTSTPITFGRDADNTLVVSDSFVSRKHGELRVEDGAWVLANLSPNGTTVSRTTVTSKPRRLRENDVIGVGGQGIFQVSAMDATAAPVEETEGEDGAPAAAPPATQSLTRRAKIWIGIAAWVVCLSLVALVLRSALSGRDTGPQSGLPTEFTAEQIEEDIRRPRETRDPNEGRSRRCLSDALSYRNSTAPDALFRAYRAYQDSLAYSGTGKFPALDDGTDDHTLHYMSFDDTRTKLTKEVVARYKAARTKLQQHQYEEAWKAFKALAAFYSDNGGPLYRNIEEHQKLAFDRKPKRR